MRDLSNKKKNLLKYNQHDATFSRSIYLYKLLYTFQVVPPPIIRSTKLYIQRQELSNQYCCVLPSWISSTTAAGSSIGLTILDVIYLLTHALFRALLFIYAGGVQFCAPDDGRRNRLKHVEQFMEINGSRKRCILLVVL